ncbi:MAG: DNA translocase FtsK [Candidatus Zapsychrus exili]|nr:DNA translocase FtsK [Candidatus Zapsychrus exili]
MKQEHISEIKAVIILAIGMILLASLISFSPQDLSWYTSVPNNPASNLIGVTGATLAGTLLFLFGYSSYVLVIFLFFWSWNKFSFQDIKFSFLKFVGALIFICAISSLFSMLGNQDASMRFARAGIAGYFISDFLIQYIGRTGAYIIIIVLGTPLALIVTGEFLVTTLFVKLFEKLGELFEMLSGYLQEKDFKFSNIFSKKEKLVGVKNSILEKILRVKNKAASKVDEEEEECEEEDPEEEEEDEEEEFVRSKAKPKINIASNSQSEDDEEDEDEPKIVGEYKLPPMDLLEDPPVVSKDKIQDGLMDGAKLLEETLANFGVVARVADIEHGPVITRYELEPAPGVKVQKFTALADDIALVMKAHTVRIVAPIPGKNRVGIEVPNSDSSFVFLKEVLMTPEFKNSDSKLMMALGKDISGSPMIADLAEMPHLMIAGTTGSGKSVCVNSIIMSMLLRASPDEVKMVMVDPKMVELARYNGIPHLLSPTVTDPKKAASVLAWVVGEMENRYKKLSKEGAHNIKVYNETEFRLPYIVVIIDELADLMQVSAKSVESSITRIAQLSRAVGIHLILATQRPSVDVITGVIKANFPARISFKVASKVDSRTVLDMNGAEALLGKGDMLLIKPGDAKPARGQGNFIKEKEISKVIQFIKDQQEASYDNSILEKQKSGAILGSDEKDEYYDEAVKLVVETNQASVSILQRRLRLGYTRAARLIDMMEQNGIVGPYCGSKPRDILVDRQQWLVENMSDEDEGEEDE